MLQQPALLNLALGPGDSVVALNNGRDLGVADVLQIENERMQIDQVISANNYHVVRGSGATTHAANVAVCQLPNPNNAMQLNTAWFDPQNRGWQPIGGVWMRGQGIGA